MNPPELLLRWCPKCGRDDRFTTLPLAPRTHFHKGVKCDGKPVRVEYTTWRIVE